MTIEQEPERVDLDAVSVERTGIGGAAMSEMTVLGLHGPFFNLDTEQETIYSSACYDFGVEGSHLRDTALVMRSPDDRLRYSLRCFERCSEDYPEFDSISARAVRAKMLTKLTSYGNSTRKVLGVAVKKSDMVDLQQAVGDTLTRLDREQHPIVQLVDEIIDSGSNMSDRQLTQLIEDLVTVVCWPTLLQVMDLQIDAYKKAAKARSTTKAG